MEFYLTKQICFYKFEDAEIASCCFSCEITSRVRNIGSAVGVVGGSLFCNGSLKVFARPPCPLIVSVSGAGGPKFVFWQVASSCLFVSVFSPGARGPGHMQLNRGVRIPVENEGDRVSAVCYTLY